MEKQKPPHKLYKVIRNGILVLRHASLPDPADRRISQSYWHQQVPQVKKVCR